MENNKIKNTQAVKELENFYNELNEMIYNLGALYLKTKMFEKQRDEILDMIDKKLEEEQKIRQKYNIPPDVEIYIDKETGEIIY